MPFLSNEGGSWKIWGISEGRHKIKDGIYHCIYRSFSSFFWCCIGGNSWDYSTHIIMHHTTYSLFANTRIQQITHLAVTKGVWLWKAGDGIHIKILVFFSLRRKNSKPLQISRRKKIKLWLCHHTHSNLNISHLTFFSSIFVLFFSCQSTVSWSSKTSLVATTIQEFLKSLLNISNFKVVFYFVPGLEIIET